MVALLSAAAKRISLSSCTHPPADLPQFPISLMRIWSVSAQGEKRKFLPFLRSLKKWIAFLSASFFGGYL
jgi:hypothetical protein